MDHLVEDHRLDGHVARDPGLVEDAVDADQAVLDTVAAELQAGGAAALAAVRLDGALAPGDLEAEARASSAR